VIIILGGSLFIALPLLTLLTLFIVGLWNARIIRSHSIALEQTSWSALGPRIVAWAQLVGVEMNEIRVQWELITTDTGMLLPGRSRGLLLSETFLRYSEWRQQDAVIVDALCQLRMNKRRNSFLVLGGGLIVLASMAFLALVPWVLVWLFPFTGTFTLLCCWLGIGTGLIVVGFIVRPSLRRRRFNIDRMTVFVTGDPLAQMVMMNLNNALSGTPATSRPPHGLFVEQRMLKLAQVMRQEWPRAPQAGLPVPAIITVNAGPHQITSSFDQATNASPVPASVYASL
jgi:hypothetical protein